MELFSKLKYKYVRKCSTCATIKKNYNGCKEESKGLVQDDNVHVVTIKRHKTDEEHPICSARFTINIWNI